MLETSCAEGLSGVAEGLARFRVGRFRFALTATSPIVLPEYKGSAFHGAFGWALRRVSPSLYQNLF